METRSRTLAKAIGWQALGLAMMTTVGGMLTGSIGLGGTLALINTGLGFLLYILYERLWTRIAWGRVVVAPGVGTRA